MQGIPFFVHFTIQLSPLIASSTRSSWAILTSHAKGWATESGHPGLGPDKNRDCHAKGGHPSYPYRIFNSFCTPTGHIPHSLTTLLRIN